MTHPVVRNASGRGDRRWAAIWAAFLVLIGSSPALAAPGAGLTGVIDRMPVGESRAEPAPGSQPVTAGPWIFTIQEVLTGEAAANAVAAASSFNQPPPAGMQYVAVRLTVVNNGNRDLMIQNGDFAVTGDRLLVHRFADLTPPSPALHGTVARGQSLDGWIVVPAMAGEGSLLLIYDSLTLTGDWADVVIALDPGAAIADAAERAAEPNQTGTSIGAPAGFNQAVATEDWVVTLHRVIEGQAVYNLFPRSDYRTTALGDTYQQGVPYWIGLEVTITNNRTGGATSFFPTTAFQPIDSNGGVFLEAMLLTPPEPSIVGGYYPGGTRTGWVLIAMPIGFALDLVRFRPFDVDDDPRYFTLSGAAGAPPRDISFDAGDIVVITEDQVNLREGPGTDTAVITILTRGARLEITGAAVQGGGRTWYPVRNLETGDEGFVVVDFLDHAD